MCNQMNKDANQYNPMPMTTVPARDFVFNAKKRVGNVTHNSGLNSSICLGSPAVIIAGRTRALRMAAGMKSSQSISQGGKGRRERRKRGRHLGR